MTDTCHMTNRTDAHRPAVLVTEDYDFVGTYDRDIRPPMPPCSAQALRAFQEAAARLAQLARMVSNSAVAERGLSQCHHCGARIRYGAVLFHRPSGSYIAVGETCLENRFELASVEFHRLRKAAELDRAERRIKKAVAEFVEAHEDLAFLAVAEEVTARTTNDYVRDVASKLRRYGSLSERQVAAVRRVLEREAERAAQVATEVKVDAPTGRHEVTGRVLTTRWQASDFGETLKCLVQVGDPTTGAWRAWGSIPSAASWTRGDVVTFRATFEPKEDDPTFAFYSRPTLPRG
jgi:hypothetical protein